MNVKHVKEGLFFVESRSKPGTYHKTDLTLMSCDCEAGKWHKLCGHLKELAKGNFSTEPVYDEKLFARIRPAPEFTAMSLWDDKYSLVNRQEVFL